VSLVLKLNLHFSVFVGLVNSAQNPAKKMQTHGLPLSKPSQSTTCGTYDPVLKLYLRFFILVGPVYNVQIQSRKRKHKICRYPNPAKVQLVALMAYLT